MKKHIIVFVAGLAVIATPTIAPAVPYASSLAESGGSVSFTLNEDADSVVVERDGDAPLNLGALSKGAHSFALPAGAYQIKVSKSAAAGWTQISSDSLTQSKYYSPKGVAVNRNAASSNFGRIYVGEGLGGAVGAGGRTTTDGIYVMGADQSDTLGQGDTGYGGGIDWSTSSYSPHKIAIAPDDSVYLTDWSDSHSGLWRCNANPQASFDEVLTNVGRDLTGLIAGSHGSVASVWVEGTGAGTKVYTLDEDYPASGGAYGTGRGDVLRYDVGTATSYAGAPIIQVADDTDADGNYNDAGVILNGLMDVVRDEDGSWWITQYRSAGQDTAGAPSLTHWQDGATGPDWSSGGIAPDLSSGYGSLDIHDELDLLAMGTNSGKIFILDISTPGTALLLDTIAHSGSSIRDVAFDAAGNLYVVSSSSETLRIYSPGGSWMATTGSDGSFIIPEPASILLLALGGVAVLRRRRA